MEGERNREKEKFDKDDLMAYSVTAAVFIREILARVDVVRDVVGTDRLRGYLEGIESQASMKRALPFPDVQLAATRDEAQAKTLRAIVELCAARDSQQEKEDEMKKEWTGLEEISRMFGLKG